MLDAFLSTIGATLGKLVVFVVIAAVVVIGVLILFNLG